MFYRCCGSAPNSTVEDMGGIRGEESLIKLDVVVQPLEQLLVLHPKLSRIP